MGSSVTTARARTGHLQRPFRQRRTERGIAYRARAPWQRRPRSSQRTGKPFTGRRGSGGWGEGVSVKVRVRRRADTPKVSVHRRAGCLESVQVRFGGGQLETCLRSIVLVVRRHEDRQGAGCLPYFVANLSSATDRLAR